MDYTPNMLLLLLPLVWGSARADEAKDSYLDAFMESHALPAAAGASSAAHAQYPAAPSQPQPQYGAPSPPQPQYGAPSPPQPQYGAPSPPQPQYGAPSPPQPQYGAPSQPQPQYGAPSQPQPQYGAPSPPQPQYGAPSQPQPQYGAPTQPQYGAPQPQYGAPGPYGAATVTTTMTTPVSFFEGLGAGLTSLISQLPLPDFHTALKILLKVIVIKGVIKIISLLLIMLFIPKLEDIVSMIGNLMEMEMDMTMDADKDDDKPAAMKPEHKPGHNNDDEDDDDAAAAGDASTAMDDMAEAMAMQGEAARSTAAARRGRGGAVRTRMLNALAARVEEAVARTDAAVRSAPPPRAPCFDSPRCSRDEPQKKAKKKAAKVELKCTTDLDCDTRGASCVSGACACAQGQVMTSDLTACLPGASEWGAPCTDAVQCVSRLLVGGSCAAKEVITSSTTSAPEPAPAELVCRCAQGYHYLRGQCWRSSGLGEACARSENCYANHDSESVACAGGVCACAPGFYQREYSSCRRVSTAFGEECGITEDCQYSDSACLSRSCGCREGYAYDKQANKCSPAAAARVAEVEASAGRGGKWRWSRREAEAEARARARGSSALTASGDVAATCTTDADCGGDGNGDCVSGVCVCHRGYYKSGNKCYPELLQACAEKGDCVMKNAVCRSAAQGSTPAKLCSCKGGYVASEDMRLCRKMTPELLTWSCLHDEQCGYFGPSATCTGKRCHCGPGTHWAATKQYCWVSKAVGESCAAAEDCAGLSADGTGAGATCSAGKCACTPGHHPSADSKECRKDADRVGAECSDDVDCTAGHTLCVDNKCACGKGYVPDASGEGCGPGVGGPCDKDTDCLAKDSVCVADSKTDSKTCSCASGAVSSATGDACLPAAAALNSTCTETAQCSGLAAHCRKGKCVCEEDEFYRDGQCRTKHNLGERCSMSSECYLDFQPERAECRNGVCKCGFDYEMPGYALACVGYIGTAPTESTRSRSSACYKEFVCIIDGT
ncbi:Protein piccolo [Frankliniella fusca]|uniref:Protein piccolo n=1 Tax=Frankliniella fusca TaxID=407009 RepID=A0AAE1LLQ7_9NEOP|nr:Protein piccolo [Frankliniella fusca]